MTRAQRGSMGWAAAGAAGLMLLCLTPGYAAASGRIKVRAGLTATGIDPNAQGQVGLGIHGNDGTFDLKVSRLDRRAAYDVVVNGVKIASLQTSGGGGGHLRFRTRPKSKDLVLGFDPRGAQLSVRSGAGHDVLVGSLPATAVDPTATACCVPDGNGGSTCQELTTDACTAATGIASQQATCIPDPCATTPPPVTTVCCTNETGDDESESECEDATDCAAAGGMVVQAPSCDPNPCAPVPPPAGDAVACCVTHENEAECEVTTTEACTASGGTAMVGTTCEPDPCASGSGSGDDGGDGSDDDHGGGNGDGGDGNGGDATEGNGGSD
jgi:hypothetical protein